MSEECEGCQEERVLIEHNIINLQSNEKVGIIKLCKSCSSKRQSRD